jgi:hypothetical protein
MVSRPRHVRSAPQSVGLCMKAGVATEQVVASAILGAPAFLSGLSDEEVSFVRTRAEEYVAPGVAKANTETLKALEHAEHGWARRGMTTRIVFPASAAKPQCVPTRRDLMEGAREPAGSNSGCSSRWRGGDHVLMWSHSDV